MRRRTIFTFCLGVAFSISAGCGVCFFASAADMVPTVRVGVYQNEPKIYKDTQGNIAGFWADIVNDIAQKEHWNLTYVFGTWDEGLQRLENGDIDLMVDVAVSAEREQKYDFNNETGLISWGILYTRKGVTLDSFMDLEGKKIAIMKSGILYSGPGGLVDILSSFGISAEIIDVQEYGDVFSLLDSGDADVGAVNWQYGVGNEANYSVDRTGIIFQPTDLKFALPKHGTQNAYLISAIDERLRDMKQDPHSMYYQSIDRHFGKFLEKVSAVPSWMRWAVLGGVVMFSLLWWVIDRRSSIREKAIKEKGEAYLHGVLNATSSAILAVGTEGKVLYHNDLFPKLWRIPKEILDTNDDKKLLDFVVSQLQDPEGFIRKVQALYASDETLTDFLSFKDGRIFERVSAPLRNGERIGRVWSFRDITNDQRAREALIENERVLKEAEEIGGFGSYVLDVRTKTWTASDTLYKMFGVDASVEHTLDTWISLLHPDDRQATVDYMMKVIATGEKFDRENRIVRRDDGVTRWVHGLGRIELGADGKPAKLIGTIQDVSKQKELDKTKSEFISIASHQLRTPVSGLSWVVEALQGECGECSPKQQQYISDLSIMTKRLNRLTEDLLRFSQIETSAVVGEPVEEVRFSELLDRFVNNLSSYAAAKKHALIVENGVAGEVIVKTSPKLLFNVFENFVSNAIEYASAGSPIGIKAELLHDFVKVTITDEGLPISAEDQRHIFERFYRGEQAKKIKPEGSGMGLYIARKIIENLGGKIGYDAHGGSITFWFSIPLKV